MTHTTNFGRRRPGLAAALIALFGGGAFLTAILTATAGQPPGVTAHPPSAQAATSDTPLPFTIAGAIGGVASAVAVQDGLAIAAFGVRLAIVDIADPAQPKEAESAWLAPDIIRQVVVTGTTAYALHGLGFDSVSFADPERPCCGRTVPVGLGVLSLAVHGRHAYVLPQTVVLQVKDVLIFDIGSPLAPREVGRIASSQVDDPAQVAVGGGHLYVRNSSRRVVEVFTLEDPVNPRRVSTVDIEGWPWGMAVDGDRLYVAAGEQVAIHDVSDPASPVQLGSFPGPGFGSLAAAGRRVFLGGRDGVLRVVDASDPDRPREIGTRRSTLYGVASAGDRIVLAEGAGGLAMAEIRADGAIATLGRVETPGGARQVAMGERAFAQFGDMLVVVDLSAPGQPEVVGHVSVADAGHLAAAGTLAFVSRSEGVDVVDAANPSAPRVVGSVEVPGTAARLAAGGDGRVVALADGRAHVVDARDPARPVVAGGVDVPHAGKVAAEGAVGYAITTGRASDSPGLDVIDLAAVDLLGHLEVPGVGDAIAVERSAVFLPLRGDSLLGRSGAPAARLLRRSGAPDTARDDQSGSPAPQTTPPGPRDKLVVVDATDPRAPREVGTWGTGGFVGHLAARKGLAYFVFRYAQGGPYYEALQVLDFRGDRVGPEMRLPNGITGLAAGDGVLLFANREAGLLEMRVPTVDPTAVTPTPTASTPTPTATATRRAPGGVHLPWVRAER